MANVTRTYLRDPGAPVSPGGSNLRTIQLITEDYDASPSDTLVQIDPSGATTKVTITLPPSALSIDSEITLKLGVASLNGKYAEIVPSGAETLDGHAAAAPFILNTAWDFATVRCDGTQWLLLGFSAVAGGF